MKLAFVSCDSDFGGGAQPRIPAARVRLHQHIPVGRDHPIPLAFPAYNGAQTRPPFNEPRGRALHPTRVRFRGRQSIRGLPDPNPAPSRATPTNPRCWEASSPPGLYRSREHAPTTRRRADALGDGRRRRYASDAHPSSRLSVHSPKRTVAAFALAASKASPLSIPNQVQDRRRREREREHARSKTLASVHSVRRHSLASNLHRRLR